MHRHFIDHWTDTTTFRVLLFLSACAVLPVLGVGVVTTVIGGSVLFSAYQRIDVEQAVFGLLSLGGAAGMIGYVRARLGARAPTRHNLAATLLLLSAGIVTALAVAGFVAVVVVEFLQRTTRWSDAFPWLGLGGLFVAANAVWALVGVAWIQRLLRRYAESTGQIFDSLPVMLLFVALALATTATLATATL